MSIAKPYFSLGFVRRGVRPSLVSFIVCLFAGIVTVLFGVLGAVGQQDASSGFHPLHLLLADDFSRILRSDSVGDILSLVVVVLIVSLICAGLEFLFGGYSNFLDARKKKVSSKASGHEEVSEWAWLLGRILWRVIVGLVAIIAAILLVQLTSWVSRAEKASVTTVSFAQNARSMIISCLIWTVVFYVVIVFMRLYTYKAKFL